MRLKSNFWHFILKAQLIAATALVASVPAIAREVAPTKQPAGDTPKAAETVVAQKIAQKIDTETTTPGITDSPDKLDENGEKPENSDPMGQVNNVSQLRDVQPTDWAYQAVRNLVERYGCIAGYPDGTFRGNRAMSRYEFAAGLNACLQQIEKLIASSRSTGGVTREDLATLQRLKDEFVAELATIRTKVDNLEARTGQLENRQFSTTTRLNGEAIISAYNAFSGTAPVVKVGTFDFGRGSGQGLSFNLGGTQFTSNTARFYTIDRGSRKFNSNTALGERVRLDFNTSFFGPDVLKTRLQYIGNTGLSSVTNTPMSDLEINPRPFQGSDTSVNLDTLYYRFPVARQAQALIAASARLTDIADPVNPYFNSGALGAVSRFGQFNPIYRLGAGAGGGLKLKLNDAIGVDIGYLGGGVSSITPAPTGDFVKGPYGAIAQLNFTPGDRFRAAITYVNSYNMDPEVGSNLSNFRQTFGNLRRFIDRPSVVNAILATLADSGLQPDTTIGTRLLNLFGLPASTTTQLAGRTTANLLNTTIGEISSGILQQTVANAITATPAQAAQLAAAGINPQQAALAITQLVQTGKIQDPQQRTQAATVLTTLQGGTATAIQTATGETTAQIASKINAGTQLTGAEIAALVNVATASGVAIPVGATIPAGTTTSPDRVSTAARDVVVNIGGIPVNVGSNASAPNLINQLAANLTLQQLFPNLNLPTVVGSQKLQDALARAGYTGNASDLTINRLLALQLFKIPGANLANNQTITVNNINLNGATNATFNTGNLAQLNPTLGQISLANVLNAADPTTQAAVGASRPVRNAFQAVTLDNLFNILRDAPLGNKTVGSVTTSDLVNAVVNARLVDQSLHLLGNQTLPLDNYSYNFPIVSNSYGLEFSYLVSRGFAIGGWAGYTNTRTLDSISLLGTTLIPRGDNKTVNGAINFAFPDLGKRGNLGGIIVGVEPITYKSVLGAGDQGPGYHIEGLYRYQLTDNVSITPGFVYLTHPDHNLSTQNEIIGTLRTSFTF